LLGETIVIAVKLQNPVVAAEDTEVAEIAVTIVVETDAEAAEDTEVVETAVTIVVETDAEAAEDTEEAVIVVTIEAVTEEVEIAVKAVMTVDHLVENTRVVTIAGHNEAVLGNLVDGVRKRTIVVPVVAEIRRGVFI